MRKHLSYASYVIRHKWWVFVAGIRLAREHGPPPALRGTAWARWILQLAVHDWSKFLPSEWIPYTNRFYGTAPTMMPGATYVSEPADPDGVLTTRVLDPGEPYPLEAWAAQFDGFSMGDPPGSPNRVPGTRGMRWYPPGPLNRAPGTGAWTPELIEILRKRNDAARAAAGPVPDPAWERRVADAFDRAWLLHQNRHPHHWQFWLLVSDQPRTGEDAPLDGRADPQTKRLRMPDRYVMEMVADWAGAGRAITGKWEVAHWYEQNQGKIRLHGDTRYAVETLLRLFEGAIFQKVRAWRMRNVAREIAEELADVRPGQGSGADQDRPFPYAGEEDL